jgi:hypothetical protein
MSIRKDYIIKHIEKIAQFIATLAGKKADSKQEIMMLKRKSFFTSI